MSIFMPMEIQRVKAALNCEMKACKKIAVVATVFIVALCIVYIC